MQTKSVYIAGSTGSIGTQALAVCKKHGIRVVGLSCGKNYRLLCEQAKEFDVKVLHIGDERAVEEVKQLFPGCEVATGEEALCRQIQESDADTLLDAIVGSAGLKPAVAGIVSKKKLALANKETIVCAGQLIMDLAKENGVTIFPVDSEHSAIFQCLLGNHDREVKRILLTASGGPFFGRETLDNIRPEDALKHPNWDMGNKITIDSATLMNKGLEVIEAYHLFGHKPIQVLVHRESIIHSMVEYVDNAIMAQLGTPDMTIPIQLSMTYPNRMESDAGEVDFVKLGTLSFYEPDAKKFRCLQLAYDALSIGGTMPCVLNGANEIAVDAFLQGNIGFPDIPKLIEQTMQAHTAISDYTLEDVFSVDLWAKNYARALVTGFGKSCNQSMEELK
ncbi:MAG: 1-deoxy-D-xylulose-5-phosphate reductoisomerase [Clostridia bacterium]|nr:1-deoxy-D-xylulose-5-phosphate reductoisomerase [Clostridia bacterium]